MDGTPLILGHSLQCIRRQDEIQLGSIYCVASVNVPEGTVGLTTPDDHMLPPRDTDPLHTIWITISAVCQTCTSHGFGLLADQTDCYHADRPVVIILTAMVHRYMSGAHDPWHVCRNLGKNVTVVTTAADTLNLGGESVEAHSPELMVPVWTALINHLYASRRSIQ